MGSMNFVLIALVYVWRCSTQSITAEITPPSPTAYFSSVLSVTCQSGTNASISKLSGDSEVSIIGNLTEKLISSFSANFNIYFTSSGSITLNISCGGASKNLILEILPEII